MESQVKIVSIAIGALAQLGSMPVTWGSSGRALAAGAGPGVSLSDSDGVMSGFLVLVDPALPACKDSASL